MKVIILAGGSGTRLWPLSRERYPKQFIKLNGKTESLFQETFRRSLLLCDANDIVIVTNNNYKFLVSGAIEELGVNFNEENIIVEPEAKNTLPAIFAGVDKLREHGDDLIVVFPSDHVIKRDDLFTNVIKSSEPLTKDSIITFGIKPEGPNTGYGYIAPGQVKMNGLMVKEFKEKPSFEKALEYIDKGYYWNSGIFMFDSKVFVEEVKEYSYEIFSAFEESNNIVEAFSKITNKISIDYGVMEKSKRVVLVPVDIGWNDLGSFDSFFDVFEEDSNRNIGSDENIVIDSFNNLIQSQAGKIIATVGVDDLIIVDNRDALLVCRRSQSQKVKDVVSELKNRNDLRTEYCVQDYRPWGHYKVLEEEKNAFKIKRITINQGKKISYQLHHHRSEHWIVVKGMAKVTIDQETKLVRSGESIYIKDGQKHRLENPGRTPLEIIEVQMGDYLEEDDIVRFDDEYGRE